MLGLAKRIMAKKIGSNLFTTSFCGDSSFRSHIIGILYGSCPTSIQDIIKWRYDQMRSNLFTAYQNYPASPFPNTTVLSATKDVLLEIAQSYFSSLSCLNNLWQYNNVGHDLPIWLDRPLDSTYPNDPDDFFDFSQKRIMIVAQDPLRSARRSGSIYISSVFGLHSKDWRRNLITTQIFNDILAKRCCLYLTDINKLFAESRQNSGKIVAPFFQNFRTMLDAEIDLFQPDLIVTWGGKATNSLLVSPVIYFPTLPTPYRYKGVKVLPVYHTNHRMGKSFFSCRGYSCKKDLYVKEILKAL